MSWREPFMWQRLLVRLVGSTLLGGACLWLHGGLCMLLVIVLNAWPWPIRISVDAESVTIRWLFVRQAVRHAELASVRLARDERRYAWPRAWLLKLERRSEPPIRVFASEPVLAQLAEVIARQLV